MFLILNLYGPATKRDSFWRSFLYVIYVVSVVAGVSVASLPVNDNSDRQKIITQYLAAAFSAIVAFTASILSLSGSESNLNAINLAKARVEKEIYEFRMRVVRFQYGRVVSFPCFFFR